MKDDYQMVLVKKHEVLEALGFVAAMMRILTASGVRHVK